MCQIIIILRKEKSKQQKFCQYRGEWDSSLTEGKKKLKKKNKKKILLIAKLWVMKELTIFSKQNGNIWRETDIHMQNTLYKITFLKCTKRQQIRVQLK
jgi:hypothetical protein